MLMLSAAAAIATLVPRADELMLQRPLYMQQPWPEGSI